MSRAPPPRQTQVPTLESISWAAPSKPASRSQVKRSRSRSRDCAGHPDRSSSSRREEQAREWRAPPERLQGKQGFGPSFLRGGGGGVLDPGPRLGTRARVGHRAQLPAPPLAATAQGQQTIYIYSPTLSRCTTRTYHAHTHHTLYIHLTHTPPHIQSIHTCTHHTLPLHTHMHGHTPHIPDTPHTHYIHSCIHTSHTVPHTCMHAHHTHAQVHTHVHCKAPATFRATGESPADTPSAAAGSAESVSLLRSKFHLTTELVHFFGVKWKNFKEETQQGNDCTAFSGAETPVLSEGAEPDPGDLGHPAPWCP